MEKPRQPLSFARLALALANDYTRLFVINADDDSYIEYDADGEEKHLIPVSQGDNFFVDVHRDAREQVWPEDQDAFISAFQRDAVLSALEDGSSFTLNYRMNIGGLPRYYFLKTIRASDHNIVIGVRDIDAQRRRELQAEEANRIYSRIAGALASRYEVIYYIDAETDSYTQYSASKQYEKLGTTKHGTDFFSDARTDIDRYIHPDDRQRVQERMEKEKMMADLQQNGTATLVYRQMLNGKYQYMNMSMVRSKQDMGHIVMGVYNMDAQVRKEQSIRERSQTFSDISLALAQQFEVIYHVNVVTNEYSEYTASDKYARLQVGAKGANFFTETQDNLRREIHPDDQAIVAEALQKDKLLATLDAYGKTFLNYRLLVDGQPQYMTLYAIRPKEESDHIIISVANVDAAKRMELAYQDAMDMANRDALTGIKNKRAYAQQEAEMDAKIGEGEHTPFAILVGDMNGLKQTNDTVGHKAGDEYIRMVSGILCGVFSHSPVFRIGGDEFAVLLKGRDYENRADLIRQLAEALDAGKTLEVRPLAFGISEFDPQKDLRVQDVFERADALMYEDKDRCKAVR